MMKALIKPMSKARRAEITRIAKEFTSGFGIPINASGWIIVDPLSAFLNTCGFVNTLDQIPANENHPQVLIMTFQDGSQFIPAGRDLKALNPGFKNWIWI